MADDFLNSEFVGEMNFNHPLAWLYPLIILANIAIAAAQTKTSNVSDKIESEQQITPIGSASNCTNTSIPVNQNIENNIASLHIPTIPIEDIFNIEPVAERHDGFGYKVNYKNAPENVFFLKKYKAISVDFMTSTTKKWAKLEECNGIPDFYETFTKDGSKYFLAEFINDSGKFVTRNVSKIFDFLYQAVETMHCASKYNLVIFDLHSKNVIEDTDSNFYIIDIDRFYTTRPQNAFACSTLEFTRFFASSSIDELQLPRSQANTFKYYGEQISKLLFLSYDVDEIKELFSNYEITLEQDENQLNEKKFLQLLEDHLHNPEELNTNIMSY